jgi:hypothetical protein
MPCLPDEARFVVALDAEALVEMGRTDTPDQLPHADVITSKVIHVQQVVHDGWISLQRGSP